MKTSILATTLTLLSSSHAAHVLLETTKCPDDSIPYGKRFDITMNLSGPFARDDLKSICGLRIISATAGVDVNAIKCQAFRDVVGVHPGSAIFTYASPAQIATNPREIKAVGCTYPAVGGQKFKRQNNGTSIASTVSSTVVSSDAATSSLGPATITSTVVVGPSSGLPASSANATTSTLSTTLTPSASQSTAPAESSGAAGRVAVGASMGLGAVAAVMAMFV